MIQKVDLYTVGEALEEVMERHYSNASNPKESELDGSGVVRSTFLGLSKNELLSFLAQQDHALPNEAEYEVRDSITGDFLRIRTRGIVISSHGVAAISHMKNYGYGLN